MFAKIVLIGTLVAMISSYPSLVQSLPSPAAVYCGEAGYEWMILNTRDGQVGLCVFPDGAACYAWEYYCACNPDSIYCYPGGDYYCHFPCADLPCKKAGESVQVQECCEGLVRLRPGYTYDDECRYTDIVGWTHICSDCGNGFCEEWETDCSCPVDCFLDNDLDGDGDVDGSDLAQYGVGAIVNLHDFATEFGKKDLWD